MNGLDPVDRLDREVRLLVADLDRQSVRSLVDNYYQWQEQRKRMRNQARAAEGAGEPTALLEHFGDQAERLERQMRSTLGEWASHFEVGRWSQAQYGVGPVISAGLLAHIDITRASTAGSLWAFSGYAPPSTYDWGKGQKRPWNAELKSLIWRMTDVFKRFSKRKECYYGQLYRERKTYEVERNESGGNAEAAERTLEQRSNLTENQLSYYEEGKLPPGRIDLRAMRWTGKLFLAAWHEVAYVAHYDRLPPAPYPLAHLGHTHEIVPPHFPDRVLELREEAGRALA